MTATKKKAKTTKKATTKNLGTATGVAEARKKKGGNADLGDVFKETAKDDAKKAKQSQSAKYIVACHALARETYNRLSTARLETSTHDAIKHDLERVILLTDDIRETAEDALRTLGR